ncbi:YceI family protein [Cellulomonas sp. S1-8]|uniref:YceI family protein n=1 Tax=Cellulomonas sp. S1-8 TaxID=2904790 RepID=UPI002244D2D7|nr:YceI family protein [Cellulomonas sp. S1-8]UZN02539.1 YceI family protein [Cellulomonas sp. S1-8]
MSEPLQATDRPVRQWKGLTIPEPGTYELDEAHKRVGFVAQHMMVSPVRGEFSRAAATIVVGEDPLQSSVRAIIATESLNTHHEDRDTHLRSPDFLDVAQFPAIEFRSTGVQWHGEKDAILQWARLRNHNADRRRVSSDTIERAELNRAKFDVTGDLRIKDVTRSVVLRMDFGGANRDPYGRDIFGFHATTDIDREDFGLVWNVALEAGGWLVGKKVRIEIAGEAVHQAA